MEKTCPDCGQTYRVYDASMTTCPNCPGFAPKPKTNEQAILSIDESLLVIKAWIRAFGWIYILSGVVVACFWLYLYSKTTSSQSTSYWQSR
jgi:type II secretory pathway component PulF